MGSKDGNFYAYQSPAVQNDLSSLLRQDWVFKTGDNILYSSPTIDQNGTIYFGSQDKCLYAINPGNMELADSSWPMLHRKADHSGFAENIQIPDVISSSPTVNGTGVPVDTAQIQVNFSPAVQTSQIQIDSFKLQKQMTDDQSNVDGQAIIKLNRYNNTGYNISAIFTRDHSEIPLEYSTTYLASISYYPASQTDKTTFSFTFTTEDKPEEDPHPNPKTDWSCFINSIFH